MNQETIRQSGDLMDNSAKNKAAGLNESTFSVGQDVMTVMKPENGVKIKKDRQEYGRGKFVSKNTNQMSLAQYDDMVR